MKRTSRGFDIYGAYKDSRGQIVRVQESSIAAGPHCWIFCNDDSDNSDAVMHLGKPVARSPHLTPAQARRVARALLRFANSHTPKAGKP